MEKSMNRYIYGIITVVCLFIIAGCNEKVLGPSHSQISEKVQIILPGHLKLNNLTINAEINEGTEVNKHIVSRFVAEVSVRETTYTKINTLNGIDILKEINPKGYSTTLYGISRATEKAGQWNIVINFENGSDIQQGETRAIFASTAILSTSPEVQKLEAKVERAKKEKLEREAALLKKQEKEEKLRLQNANNLLEELLASGKAYEGMSKHRDNEYPFSLKFDGENSSLTHFKSGITYKMVQPRLIKSQGMLMISAQDNKYKNRLYRWDFYYDETSNSLIGSHHDHRGRRVGPITIKLN
jgi:hypothetical protein